jgi:hypothetical protein
MKKKFKKSPNTYLALLACIVAVGLASIAALREDSVSTVEPEEFTRIRIEWSAEETEVPLTNEVNIRVSGVEDERTLTTTLPVEKNKPFSGEFARIVCVREKGYCETIEFCGNRLLLYGVTTDSSHTFVFRQRGAGIKQ